jgi:kinesin family protein 1
MSELTLMLWADSNARMIRELKEELEMLRARSGGSSMTSESSFDPSVP